MEEAERLGECALRRAAAGALGSAARLLLTPPVPKPQRRRCVGARTPRQASTPSALEKEGGRKPDAPWPQAYVVRSVFPHHGRPTYESEDGNFVLYYWAEGQLERGWWLGLAQEGIASEDVVAFLPEGRRVWWAVNDSGIPTSIQIDVTAVEPLPQPWPPVVDGESTPKASRASSSGGASSSTSPGAPNDAASTDATTDGGNLTPVAVVSPRRRTWRCSADDEFTPTNGEKDASEIGLSGTSVCTSVIASGSSATFGRDLKRRRLARKAPPAALALRPLVSRGPAPEATQHSGDDALAQPQLGEIPAESSAAAQAPMRSSSSRSRCLDFGACLVPFLSGSEDKTADAIAGESNPRCRLFMDASATALQDQLLRRIHRKMRRRRAGGVDAAWCQRGSQTGKPGDAVAAEGDAAADGIASGWTPQKSEAGAANAAPVPPNKDASFSRLVRQALGASSFSLPRQNLRVCDGFEPCRAIAAVADEVVGVLRENSTAVKAIVC